MSKTSKGKTKRKHDREEKESLAFKILSQNQTQELLEIEDVDQLETKLISIVGTEAHQTDLQAGSLLDYYVSGLWWAKEQGFTVEQASAFYTVINTLLENVKEKHMETLENLREFKKMLAGIGQEHGDISGGLECFDVHQAQLISDYVNTSFFQHYKLFEFIISHTQAEEIIGTDLEIEVPLPAEMPWPPPLEEGVPEEIFNEYIAPPPPIVEEEEGEKTQEELEAEQKAAEEAAAQAQAEDAKVIDLLSQLTTEDVKNIMNGVFEDMLGGLKMDVANKLKDKENAFITRINKVHRVAEK